ncbi:HAD hydrolase family protein [Candidatus Daviesbacteria bacterium]|nr:HAD hydrolase family protein [Candidatus Daviesbacteria bacterium]
MSEQDRFVISQSAELAGQDFPLIIEREGKRFAVTAFTDLDGTANDETLPESERLATIEPAREAIAELEKRKIPAGIVSGRSFGEALLYQNALKGHGFIICEDGAVVVLPNLGLDLTSEASLGSRYHLTEHEGRRALVLSKIDTATIGKFLSVVGLRSDAVTTIYSSPEQIQQVVGHPTSLAARLSADRLASAYIAQASPEQLQRVTAMAPEFGIRTFGVPLHLIGTDADKGEALQVISDNVSIFFPNRGQLAGIIPVVFGNNVNDIKLIQRAETMGGVGVLVGHPMGGYFVPEDQIPQTTIKATKPYGLGMREAIPQVLERLKI